jgi:hypothetical protein
MNSFDLVRDAAEEGSWSEESQIVVLCHFLDQLQENIRAAGGADILVDFERYLKDQLEQERDASGVITLEQVEIPDLAGWEEMGSISGPELPQSG